MEGTCKGGGWTGKGVIRSEASAEERRGSEERSDERKRSC